MKLLTPLVTVLSFAGIVVVAKAPELRERLGIASDSDSNAAPHESGEFETLRHTASFDDDGAAGTDALVLYSGGVDAVFSDRRDAGLKRAIRMLDERLVELREDFDAGRSFPSESIQLAYDVLTSPFCVRVGVSEPGTASTAPETYVRLTVSCASGANAQQMKHRFEELLRGVGMPLQKKTEEVSVGTSPFGALTATVASDAQSSTFQLALGTPGREAFEFGRTGLPSGSNTTFFARYDGERMGELVEPFIAPFGGERPFVWDALEMLGLLGKDAPERTWATGATRTGSASASRVRGYVGLAKKNGLFVDDPLDASDFQRIPSDATFVRMSQFRVDGLLGLLDRFEPGAAAQAVAMAQAMTGVDLKGDFFDHLGPTVGVYWSRGSGGGGLLSTVAFIETTNPDAVAGALRRLSRAAEGAAKEFTDGRVAFLDWKYDSTPVTTLTFPGLPVPLELSFAVADDALFVGASRTALGAALAQLERESDVLQHPHLSGLPSDATDGVVSFGFVDTPFFVQRGYGTASFFATAFANALRSPYDPERDPGSILPPLRSLAGAKPAVTFGRIEGDDLVEVGTFDGSWAVNGTAAAGSPLTNAYAGIAGLAMVSSISIPKLMSARLSANENAAIATMRSLASAQAQMQAAAAIDCDNDGTGEYGTLAEMAGMRPLRVASASGATWGRDELDPPILPIAFGNLIDDGTGFGVIERSGYYIQVWLPGRSTDGTVPGISDPVSTQPGAEIPTSADLGESYWCAYAWPVQLGQTGSRTFFMNQAGDVLSCNGSEYSGLGLLGGRQPAFDAAFTKRNDMTATTAMGSPSARDGSVWLPVGY